MGGQDPTLRRPEAAKNCDCVESKLQAAERLQKNSEQAMGWLGAEGAPQGYGKAACWWREAARTGCAVLTIVGWLMDLTMSPSSCGS